MWGAVGPAHTVQWSHSDCAGNSYNANFVIYQVLTVSSRKVTAFRDIAPSSLVEVGRGFTGTYCLHLQDVDNRGSTYLSV